MLSPAPCSNILYNLEARRTLYGDSRYQCCYHRLFYKSIVPNRSVHEIDEDLFVRKFSPTGSHLICFSNDLKHLHVLHYLGACRLSAVDLRDPAVFRSAFRKVFSVAFSVPVATESEFFHRDFLLFSQCARFVICASSCLSNTRLPHRGQPYENTTLYCVDLLSGRVTSVLKFSDDKIFLHHNAGVCLYQSRLAVLCVNSQKIVIYELTSSGQFVFLLSVGETCLDDDGLFLSYHPEPAPLSSSPALASANPLYPTSFTPASALQNPAGAHSKPMLSAFRQRLMAQLYAKASRKAAVQPDRRKLLDFYNNFDQYASMAMWKCQFLDEDHLLIRMICGNELTSASAQSQEGCEHHSLLVFYQLSTATVLRTFRPYSTQLLQYYERDHDYFVNLDVLRPAQFHCSLTNCPALRKNHLSYKNTALSSRHGTQHRTISRILSNLPVSSQAYNISPYLDMNLFHYDNKATGPLEKLTKLCSSEIRFFDRQNENLSFLLTVLPPQVSVAVAPNAAQSCVLIFHPIEPFCISLVKNSTSCFLNFHLRVDDPQDEPAGKAPTLKFNNDPAPIASFSRSAASTSEPRNFQTASGMVLASTLPPFCDTVLHRVRNVRNR